MNHKTQKRIAEVLSLVTQNGNGERERRDRERKKTHQRANRNRKRQRDNQIMKHNRIEYMEEE